MIPASGPEILPQHRLAARGQAPQWRYYSRLGRREIVQVWALGRIRQHWGATTPFVIHLFKCVIGTCQQPLDPSHGGTLASDGQFKTDLATVSAASCPPKVPATLHPPPRARGLLQPDHILGAMQRLGVALRPRGGVTLANANFLSRLSFPRFGQLRRFGDSRQVELLAISSS